MEKYQYHIFSPYRVCPLGAHVDHQHGLVTGFAIDKGVDLYFDVRGQMEDGRCDPHVHLESRTFEGTVDFSGFFACRWIVIECCRADCLCDGVCQGE